MKITLDLTSVALVLFTRWLFKATKHQRAPGWGGHTGQAELCWLKGKAQLPAQSPLLSEHPPGLWILGMQSLFTVTARSGMALLPAEEGAATVMPHTRPSGVIRACTADNPSPAGRTHLLQLLPLLMCTWLKY